jgi:hypothetical protein
MKTGEMRKTAARIFSAYEAVDCFLLQTRLCFTSVRTEATLYDESG